MNDIEQKMVEFLDWIKENVKVKRISDSPKTMGELMWSIEKEVPIPGKTDSVVTGFNLYTSTELLEFYKKSINA